MFAGMQMRDVAAGFARGAVPTLVLFACLALAFVWEDAGFLLSFGGLAVYGVLTASAVLWAQRAFTALVAAVLPAALVAAGIVVGSWIVIPLFSWLLLAATGVHLTMRLLEDRGALLAFTASAASFVVAGLFAWLTFGAGTVVMGIIAIVNLVALYALRLRLGPPPAEAASA